MGFNGWMSFAGNELLNEERVRAYVANALPTLRMPVRCIDERGLAGLLDDPPYRTPALDDAPWVDYDNPDSYGFLGAFPLKVQGLTDSTRTGTVLQNMGDGGAVAGLRRGTKEIRVTALLIGENGASVEAGKRWLAGALDGACDPCTSADLCFLVGNGADSISMGDYATSTLSSQVLTGPPANWSPGFGVFTPTTISQAVDTPLAPYPLPCDEIFYTWKIAAASSGTTIAIETLGETGVTNTLTATVPTSGGTYTISDRGISDQKSWCRLRVTSAPGESITITAVDMEFRTDPPEDACFAKYARQLRKVTCIAGPTTIEEFEPSVGAMETVEFAFSASPYVYGLPVEVLSVEGRTVKVNKRNADVFELTKQVPTCKVPKIPQPISDPDCPAVPVAPKPNVSVTSCAKEPAFQTYYALAIPDNVIPLWSEAVPILSLTTGTAAARRTMVRFMPRPFPTQAPQDLDPCSICGEFVIDYIPPNSTFTLNGVEEIASIEQPGGRVSDAGHLLSGTTSDRLFQWPVLTCGTGYLALVDISTEGVERFDLSIAVRE